MKLYKIILLIFSFTLLTNCTEEIDFEADFEPQLFISGVLINGTNYVIIDIQETVEIDDLEKNPVNNATISLFMKDESGTQTLVSDTFIETDGIYRSSQQITSILGNTYWTQIVLEDGTTYISDKEELRDAVTIVSVEKNTDNIRITFEDSIDVANFYLFHIDYFQDGEFLFDQWEISNDILFNGNDNAFIELYEDFEGDNLSVNVSIHNLNYNTFQFYLNSLMQFESQLNSDGSLQLFLPPPANLEGNIINTTKNERALGFFGVISTSNLYAFF